MQLFSIKTKLILAYTVIFGVLLVIFAAIIYNSTKEAAFLRLNTNLKSYSISLRTEIADQLEDKSFLNIKKLSSIKAEGLTGERFELFGKTGKIIIKDSVLSKLAAFDFSSLSINSFLYEKKKIHKHKYHLLWSKFETENDSVYFLETAALSNDVFEELDRLLYLFLIIIPAGLIITGFAARFISNAAFKPITKMAATAQNISGENLEERLELPRANDEVRVLAKTLNGMIERIDNTFKSQKRFIANASHEFKTPLTVIQTELELLEKRIKDAESADGIKNALSEIENLTRLTNSLLTVAKLDASKTKLNKNIFRIDELLADCSQALNQSALKKNIQINLSIEEAVEIDGDREKLKSAFLNLIDNAIKYSFRDSSIKINLQKIKNNKIMVEVIDNGQGILPAEIPYIFNRFYRSNEIRSEISGSGLGLAIAKEIIELHKGEIKIESRPGKFTIFSVTLPA